MNTERTPQNTRQGAAGATVPAGAAAAAGAAAPVGTPGAFNAPPPMIMSPDQFQAFLETCKGTQPPVMAMNDDGGADFPNVSSVSVKLPTFWTHDPDLWFLQTESVFNTRTPKVTRDATKFDHVVTALPADALNKVQNIIRMPATTPDRYQRLKTTLQTTYGKTAAQRHVELIEYASSKEPVLDVKPSNMLMYINDLIGDSKDAFVRAVHILNRLPHSVRTTLSTSSAPNNEALALEANDVMEAYLLARPGATPASIMALESMQQLPPSVAAVSGRQQQQQGTPFLCHIHQKYGTRAFSCKSSRCPMHDQVQRRPPSSAPGNSRAGR